MKAAVMEQRGQPLLVKDIADPLPPAEDEVLIDVMAAGICHTDLHIQDGLFSDLGIELFPLVPGHETVGVVREVGSSVSHLLPGDRVGVYWIYPCGHCSYCFSGEEQACASYLPRMDANGFARQGGFATTIKIPADHALKLPETLSFAKAAPLLCGGMTVYAGLKKAHLRPGQRVAILGIGGLGHLAIQIAKAMGAEVIAATSTASKRDLAIELGARDVVVGGGDIGAKLKDLGGVDVVLSSTLDSAAIASVTAALRPLGTVVLTGFTSDPIPVVPLALAVSQQSVIGSLIASRRDTEELLQLAAQQRIEAISESFSLEEVNLAYEKLRKNDVRYRAVLCPN